MIPEKEDPELQYCELIEEKIKRDHPFFRYVSEVRLAEASLGLAISKGSRVQEVRLILDMLDTLMENLYEKNTVLSDPNRKTLNHADEVWLDLKEKLSQGDQRTAYLLSASAHIQNATSLLLQLRSDKKFEDKITEYQLKYMGKLSVYVYREAIGHVLL